MQQTEQYGLNQWELSDRIRMEDFNADNAKIEAELARLRQNVFDLAFYIGQICQLNEIKADFYSCQFPILHDAFHHPNSFTCSGGVVIADHRAKLTGKGAAGALSTTRSFISATRTGGLAKLYIHHNKGTVTPYLNGALMTLTERYPCNSPTGGFLTCEVYTLEAPFASEVTLRLDLNCGNDSSMELFDVCLAQL